MILKSYLQSVNRQLALRTRNLPVVPPRGASEPLPPVITLSRQSGAGARSVARELLGLLEEKPGAAGWIIFDEMVAASMLGGELPGDHEEMRDYLEEAQVNDFQAYLGELFGLHPPIQDLFEKTRHAIEKLAEKGRVIFVGRGATQVVGRRPGAFHFRLVADDATRRQRLAEFYHLGPKDAEAYLKRKDTQRADYLKRYFEADPADTAPYHAVLNTGLLTTRQAAEMIAGVVRGAKQVK
ncbi:MAG: cytidylate kinase-like family protein [Puniceicoccaceae bacterium]|nr:MAG: cytidylate kinase-like family protein [Puniceicoccaceae bacterium]